MSLAGVFHWRDHIVVTSEGEFAIFDTPSGDMYGHWVFIENGIRTTFTGWDGEKNVGHHTHCVHEAVFDLLDYSGRYKDHW